jgi:hypothetical protein
VPASMAEIDWLEDLLIGSSNYKGLLWGHLVTLLRAPSYTSQEAMTMKL